MFIIDNKTCTGCGGCQDLCFEIAIVLVNGLMKILEGKCTGCKICLKVCPVRAITEE
jgi:MinD superfamily P-loop ATPase